MTQELQRIEALLGMPVDRAAFRVGSHVYGTAGPASDHDYLVIVSSGRQDLVLSQAADVIVHTAETFQAALNRGNIMAFEALCAPSVHRLKEPEPPFTARVDLGRLVASAIERSGSDFDAARRRFDSDPGRARRSLFHSLRVPLFAREIALTGRLISFDAANGYFEDVMTDPSDSFARLEAAFGPLRAQLCEALRAVNPTRCGW